MSKAFVPLESNPQVFTALSHALGLSPKYEFTDVFSLTDPDLLAFIPRPVHALILVFPISPAYEQFRHEADAHAAETAASDPASPARYSSIAGTTAQNALWYPQTIKNACGTYAILHTLANAFPRSSDDASSSNPAILPGSLADTLLRETEGLSVEARAQYLEASRPLYDIHHQYAAAGSTDAPAADDDNIDLHFVAFTRAARGADGDHLAEYDGRRVGPIVHLESDLSGGRDVLDPEQSLPYVLEYFKREKENPMFSIIALVDSE
ncbi:hypothetical protein D0Z00_001261 [Geotrichum galactomycetum]|uniref:Uncharacterized protein n=1 Tax=Geotrichum galactomycetum TaxID=27317 RepID=A0ACB6V7I3_9ASCO|nr:hypothetical protein D0Z00_001261 [Geotrichum candidum]